MTVQTSPLQITIIHESSDAVPYLEAWCKLAAGRPMRSPDWLLAWWDNYGTEEDELRIVLVHEQNGDLIGLAPLYLEGVKRAATFRLLGSADACTHHTTWIVEPGRENQVGIEVARYLLKCRSEWKRVLFEAVDADAASVHATMAYLAENRCLFHQRRINSVWKIALPETWDEYLMLLSRSHRKRCRKLQRQFLDSDRIKIYQIKSEVELDKGFKILLELHRARWGNSREPYGVFGDRRFLEFHQTISRKLLVRNQLRLAWLEYDGRPLAVEYQFFDSEAVYAYQAGVDLSMDQFSPGRLSMMAAIRFAIARGCKFFDLLRGDDPYKENWRATPTACHDLRVWQNGLMGHIAWIMWQSYTWIVRQLKPVIPDSLINWGLKLLKR